MHSIEIKMFFNVHTREIIMNIQKDVPNSEAIRGHHVTECIRKLKKRYKHLVQQVVVMLNIQNNKKRNEQLHKNGMFTPC